MTTNPLDDNVELSAVFFNALTNARAGELVVSGLTPSPGSGSWDVDIAAGSIQVDKNEISVSADTLTHDAADASLNRVDIITADDSGVLSITKGTAAADPAAPDIPANEVLIAAVLFDSGASSLDAADILNYRVLGDTLHQFTASNATQFKVNGGSATQSADVFEGDDVEFVVPSSPIYGDGSDGAANFTSSGGAGSRVQYRTQYSVGAGATRTVGNGGVFIHATEKITVAGTLTAAGEGGAGSLGATGATGDNDSWSGGISASDAPDLDWGFSPGGSGGFFTAFSSTGPTTGGGGAGGRGFGPISPAGGRGGDASDGYDSSRIDALRSVIGGDYDTLLTASETLGGAGGGGGGSGAVQDDPSFSGNGGNGGDGGGYIILAAPVIEVSGTIDVSGEDGTDAASGSASSGSGGGGGGGGGLIVLICERLVEDSPTYNVSGGLGGSGSSGVENGQNGADGADGTIIKVVSA